MRPALIFLVAILIPSAARSEEVTVEGLVYNRTRILEADGPSPPSPEDVGVPGVAVVLIGGERPHSGGAHEGAETDEQGRVQIRIDRTDDSHNHALGGAARYGGVWYPFRVSPDNTFEVAVYELTNEASTVRVTRHKMTLEPFGNPAASIHVEEEIGIVNDGPRAFQGIRPVPQMSQGLIATIRATGSPHAVEAMLLKSGVPLRDVPVGGDVVGVIGTVPPTGPEGDTILLSYAIHVGEGGGGTITRPIYYRTKRMQILYPRTGIRVRVPEGFSDPRPPSGEAGAKYLLLEASNLPEGGEIRISLSFPSDRFYWVIGGFAGAFLFALTLAFIAARRGARAVEAPAPEVAVPGADGFDPEVQRLLGKIDSLEESDEDEPIKRGKRMAFMEEIVDALLKGRSRTGTRGERDRHG